MNPWVPIHDAAMVMKRSIKSVRAWVHADEIRSACDVQTRALLVHWVDARDVGASKAKRERRQDV